MGNPQLTSLVEVLHDGGFLVSEANGRRARDSVKVAIGNKIPAGMVLGQITLGLVTAAAVAGNHGNAVIAMDAVTPLLANAKVGTYLLTCIVAGANAATYRLTDPKGNVLGDYSYSVSGGNATFNNQIKGTITDGATDNTVGDAYTVTVAAGSGKVVPFNPANLDGSGIPCGILFGAVDATLADKLGLAIVRDAEVNLSELIWDASVTTTPQKTAALAVMAQTSLIAR